MKNRPTNKTLREGDRDYKAYVGPVDLFESQGDMQFDLLKKSGMKPDSFVADIGCGSLRGGRKTIPFLNSERYFGIEPNYWLVEEGIKKVIGHKMNDEKKPQFSKSSNFDLSSFGKTFDFVVAQSIFSHTSKTQITECLEQIKKTLKEDGVFLATFKVGKKDYEGQQWVYPGVVFFTPETINKLIEQSGLIGRKCEYVHVNMQTWYAIGHPNNLEKIISTSKLL